MAKIQHLWIAACQLLNHIHLAIAVLVLSCLQIRVLLVVMPLLAAISQQRWKNLRGGGVISLTMEAWIKKKNLSLASLSFTVAITQPCQDTLGKAVWTSLRVGVRQLQGSLSNPSTVKPKSWEAATDVLKDLEPLFPPKVFRCDLLALGPAGLGGHVASLLHLSP